MIARIYRVLCTCFSALAANLRRSCKSGSELIEFTWKDPEKKSILFETSTKMCCKQIRLYVCISPDYQLHVENASKYEWYFVVKEDMDRDPSAFQCGCADSVDEAKDIAEAVARRWIRKQQE